MHELFVLGNQDNDAKNKQKTETAAIFAGTGSEVKIKRRSAKPRKSVSQATVVDPNIAKESEKTPALSASSDPSDDNRDAFGSCFVKEPSEKDASPFELKPKTVQLFVKTEATDSSQSQNDISKPLLLTDQSCLENQKQKTNEPLPLVENPDVTSFSSTSNGDATESTSCNSTPSNTESNCSASQKSDKLKSSFLQALKKFKENRGKEAKMSHHSSKNSKSRSEAECDHTKF